MSAHDDGTVHPEPSDMPAVQPVGVAAACAGGPTIDGLLLDECVDRSFTVGGVNKTVRVWYTKVMSVTTRIDDGTTYNLQHWITTDAQAQQVAAWFEDAWVRYFTDFGPPPLRQRLQPSQRADGGRHRLVRHRLLGQPRQLPDRHRLADGARRRRPVDGLPRSAALSAVLVRRWLLRLPAPQLS